MKKVQINNQVISMRKLVKQAKVHMINKLVKEVKLLNRKNGDETKIAKYKRKAERLLLEINIMKKTKADAVSKMALSNKDYSHVISDKSASLEDRVMSRLISFGPLQKEAQQFNSKFPHLVTMLPDVFQQWEVKKHHDSQDEKGLKAVEIQKRNGGCFKKRLTHTDFELHEPVLGEKFNSGVEENSSAVDILSAVSEVEEKCQIDRKEKNIKPVIGKLQQDKKVSQNESSVGKFCDASHDSDTLSKCEKLIKVRSTKGSKTQCHMQKLKSSGVSDSRHYGNKSDHTHNTKYNHKFRKLPNAEKSAKSGRTNKELILSRALSTSVKRQERSTWISAGTNKLKGKKKVLTDISKWKHDVSVNQRSAMASGKAGCFEKADEKTSASLHPSWKAKRKMNMQTKSFLPFQGKKVKFDE